MENKETQRTTIAQLVETSKVEASDDAAVNTKVSSADSTVKSVAESTQVLTAEQQANEESGNEPHSQKTEVFVNNDNSVKLLDRLVADNMLVPGSEIGRQIRDDYRRIKRPLVANACGKNKAMLENGNLMLVTSSLPGEGKTYTSINLALSISQEVDISVLLVDCDVARHGVSRALGIEKRRGLVDVLENDDVNIGDVMLRTDIPNFRVVSAGKQNDFVTELLASKRMARLVDELAERYSDRVIIFDGPPLLPTPQTQILAGLVGQVVFIIESGKTPQSFVEEALSLIPEDQAVGIVLNKNEGVSGRGGYYYGYYGAEDE